MPTVTWPPRIGGQGFTTARIGDVVDLGRIGADSLDDQAGRDVIGAAGGATGPGDRAGIGLELGDQVVHGLESASRRARR